MVIYRSFYRWLLGIGLIIAMIAHANTASAEDSKRQKSIDFEDEVVEGMNKRPLDSVSQISEKDRNKRKPHLYRKRAGFRDETIQTLGEIKTVAGTNEGRSR